MDRRGRVIPGKRVRAGGRPGLIPTRRPPEPRAAEADYLRFSRTVFELWGRAALDWSDDPMPPSRAEILDRWNGILAVSGLRRLLARVSNEIDRSNTSYLRSIFKRALPKQNHAPIRDQWLTENAKLWRDLGEELADRLLETLRRPRLDADRAVTRAVNAARKANVALVQGLDLRQTLSLGRLLKAGQEQGVRHETLVESVEQITGYGTNRAKLIARDQTVKHNAAVQQAQAKAAGVNKYRWRTVRDEAVRPMHAKLDGQVFSFDQPPVTNKNGDRNNPGGDYQCRCQAEIVIDLFAGLDDL